MKRKMKEFKKGVQQEKIQMIKGMYEPGISIEMIAKVSKLNIDEVERIFKKKTFKNFRGLFFFNIR